MELGLEGRSALVTGASLGIGRTIAERLAEAGCNVAICARNEERLEATAAELSGRGPNVHAVTADVTDPEAVEALVDETVDAFGTVHVLVNNVGHTGNLSPFHELSDEEWESILDVNLLSAVRVTRAVLSLMREQGWGRIVNVASESGVQPDAVKPHYNASKAALINLTKSLSKAYGEEGILVNAVSPATTWTPLVEDIFRERAAETGATVEEVAERYLNEDRPNIAVGRLGRPEDVADVVAFLASERASFVTGANYRVDGGSIASMDT